MWNATWDSRTREKTFFPSHLSGRVSVGLPALSADASSVEKGTLGGAGRGGMHRGSGGNEHGREHTACVHSENPRDPRGWPKCSAKSVAILRSGLVSFYALPGPLELRLSSRPSTINLRVISHGERRGTTRGWMVIVFNYSTIELFDRELRI